MEKHKEAADKMKINEDKQKVCNEKNLEVTFNIKSVSSDAQNPIQHSIPRQTEHSVPYNQQNVHFF